MSGKAGRMKVHVSKCIKSSEPDPEGTGTAAQLLLGDVASGSSTDVQSPPKRKLKQSDLSNKVVKTSKTDTVTLDEKVAKFFYACNIPFSCVEHPTFQDLITSLRPGYQPPTRKAIGGTLLDSVSEKLQDDMRKNLDGKEATLVEDGWSNIHNDPVTATCLHVDGTSYFVEPMTQALCLKQLRIVSNNAKA
ncbi:hypothetical protein HOLleu_16915 [Holothuria leucospilota]|uniref:DUF659 domain-containing protein n=1 Tax=Holothuria leucospilota TaxID=206669 RepID=A0A9Q1C755_HOLLE|nr:hypothetical protein HOLleu_16915 [Holothuria leucospilota]